MRAFRILFILFSAVFSIMLVSLQGCAKLPDPWNGTTKLKVLTTIAPVYCFAAMIGEPDAEVLCLLGSQGPHDYQTSPHEAGLIATADLFIASGHGLEEFLDDTIRNANNPKLKIV